MPTSLGLPPPAPRPQLGHRLSSHGLLYQLHPLRRRPPLHANNPARTPPAPTPPSPPPPPAAPRGQHHPLLPNVSKCPSIHTEIKVRRPHAMWESSPLSSPARPPVSPSPPPSRQPSTETHGLPPSSILSEHLSHGRQLCRQHTSDRPPVLTTTGAPHRVLWNSAPPATPPGFHPISRYPTQEKRCRSRPRNFTCPSTPIFYKLKQVALLSRIYLKYYHVNM